MENNDQNGTHYSPSTEMPQTLNVRAGNSDEDISLKEFILRIREFLRYLLSKWLIIIIAGIVGGLIGLAYALEEKPEYTATTTFVLENGDGAVGGMGQYAGLASMVGIDLDGGGGGIFQGDNIIELYKSRTMIQKALLTAVDYKGEKKLLIERYIDINNLRKNWLKKPELTNIQFDLQVGDFNRIQDSVLGIIGKDINDNLLTVSKPNKKLSIIQVDVRASDEFFAKNFNDQIVKNVNDFYVQTKTKKSLENVAILQQKTDSVRAVMNGAIYQAASVSDATPNLNLTRQVQRAAPMQRSQFTAETNKAILGELVKNLEMSKISLRKETPLIQVIDTPVFPLYKEKLGILKGMILGGLIAGFLTIIILSFKKIINSVLA